MSNGRFEPMGGWGYAGGARRVSTGPRAVDVIRAREELLGVTSPVLGEEVELVPTGASHLASQPEAEVVAPEPRFTEFPIAEL